jgi:hypothetical protein
MQCTVYQIPVEPESLKSYILKVIEKYPGKTRHFIVTTLYHWYLLGKCPRFYDPDAYAAMDELLHASRIRAVPPKPGGHPYMYFVNRDVVQHG